MADTRIERYVQILALGLLIYLVACALLVHYNCPNLADRELCRQTVRLAFYWELSEC